MKGSLFEQPVSVPLYHNLRVLIGDHMRNGLDSGTHGHYRTILLWHTIDRIAFAVSDKVADNIWERDF
jgi:hypothetical protein